jgi:transmembrane sensor
MADQRRDRRLPVPLDQLVHQGTPAHVRELWLELGERRARRQQKRRPRVRTWLSVAACFVVLLGSALALSSGLGLPEMGQRPLLTAQGDALPASMHTTHGYQAFDLSDGSRITVVRGARLDVLESSPRTVALALRTGRVRFDVRPRGPRAWRIDCGAFAVEVVGTKFVLERGREGLRVEVLHGAVLVRGEGIPDGVQRLDAGQSLHARAPVAQAAGAVQAPRDARRPILLPLTTLVADAPGEVAQETEPLLPQRSVRRRQRAAASDNRHRAADNRRRAADNGHRASDNVEALFREADKARLEGRLADAVVALRRILERHVDDSRAALAGFALGRLQLSALKQPELAARHFQLALALGLPAALSEDAHVKLAEAHEKAGDHAAACSAWSDYARRFPQGIKREAPPVRCEVDSAR